MRTTVIALSTALLLACGTRSSGANPGGGGGGSVAGSGGGGGEAAGGGGSGGQDLPFTGIAWETVAEKLPLAVDHHATWAATTPAGTFLYVAGGVTTESSGLTFRDAVQRAAIGADGTLGPFEALDSLPHPRAGAAVAVVGRTVVLAGGFDGDVHGDVSVGATGDDGRVAWSAGPGLPMPRFHAAGAVSGSHVYVIGGLDGSGTATDTILRSSVREDGTLTGWEALDAAPGPISHEGVAVQGGFLWVVGGIAGAPSGPVLDHGKVWRVPIRDDGTLGAWDQVSDLQFTRATHSVVVVRGQLVAIGGVIGNSIATASVVAAPITVDGVGDWVQLASLPRGRSHLHQTPVVGDHIYSVGGSNLKTSLDDVVIGTVH